MGQLRSDAVATARDSEGNPVRGARRYVYRADASSLSPLFSDPGLTIPQANPMISDENGEFAVCYLIDGRHRIILESPKGQPLQAPVEIAIQAPLTYDQGAEFPNVQAMLSDRKMSYFRSPNAHIVSKDEHIRVVYGGFCYRVAETDAQDHHLETDGGVKLYALPNGEAEFSARQFGAVEGSDISTALQAAIDAALYNVDRSGAYMANVLIDIHDATLSRTIHVGYGGTDQKSIQLRGFGGMYTTSTESHTGTALTYTPTNGAAFVIQGGRKPKLKGFTVYGQARDTIELVVGDDALDFFTPEVYDDKYWDGLLWSADVTPNNRYAPYAGIAIDPRSGDQPAAISIDGVASTSPAVITTATAHNLNDKVPETVTISGLTAQGISDGTYFAVYATATTAELYALDWSATTGTGTGTGTLAYPYYDAPPYPAAETDNDPSTGKKRCSGFVLDDIGIQGFEVGTVVNPGTLGSNGDFGQIRDVEVSYSKFAHAVCQANARTNHYYKCNPFGIFSFLTNVRYGMAIGNVNAKVEGMGGGYMVKWFEAGNTSRMSACQFDQCHPEDVGMIGTLFGGAAVGSPIVFNSCVMKFKHTYCTPSTLLDNPGCDPAPIVMNGGILRVDRPISILSSNIAINGTFLDCAITPDKEYRAQAVNNALIVGATPNVTFGSPSARRYDLGNLTAADTLQLDSGLTLTGADYGIPYFSAMVSGEARSENGRLPTVVPRSVTIIATTQRSFSATPITDRTITWSFTGYGETRMRQNGIINGAVLMDEKAGVTMTIRSIDYVTREIICTLESNWYDNTVDTPTLLDTGWDPAENNWHLFRTEMFTPPSRIVGDFTSGSNIVTNVRTEGRKEETDFGLSVGAWLSARFGPAGAYIGENTAITAIDTTAATITLTQNALISITGAPLDIWLRAPAPNETDA